MRWQSCPSPPAANVQPLSSVRRRGKTNFFERRVGEYQRAGVMQSVAKQGSRKYEHVFSLSEDF
jgi:hypothetical protein